LLNFLDKFAFRLLEILRAKMDLIPEGLQNGLNFSQRVSNFIVANFQKGLKQGWRIAQDVLPETKMNFFNQFVVKNLPS
jgi:hypothetical protein